MRTTKTFLIGVVALLLSGRAAEAALQSRMEGQAYYDDVLNITWVADANLAATNAFGVADIGAWGVMTWPKANEWVAAMNAASYLGKNDWRLPALEDTGAPGCDYAYSGTDCGYNVDLATSEMANLFYGTLGNLGYHDTSGAWSGCTPLHPPGCLANRGPFANIQADVFYWAATAYAAAPDAAWTFNFRLGEQTFYPQGYSAAAWVVRTGDIAPPDSDGDGIPDDLDNCTLVANPTQLDSDGDGYGNLCDPDFNGDGVVNINDYNRLRARLGIDPVVDLATDLDGNGAVNINDMNRLKTLLGHPPGPSGLHPDCPPTCP